VARRVLAKGRRRIEPYLPAALGIDLEALLANVQRWNRWLEDQEGDAPPVPRLLVARPAELR
jgi:hypothetical protein